MVHVNKRFLHTGRNDWSGRSSQEHRSTTIRGSHPSYSNRITIARYQLPFLCVIDLKRFPGGGYKGGTTWGDSDERIAIDHSGAGKCGIDLAGDTAFGEAGDSAGRGRSASRAPEAKAGRKALEPGRRFAAASHGPSRHPAFSRPRLQYPRSRRAPLAADPLMVAPGGPWGR